MKTDSAMFVSVHADDETLGCGGTILRLRKDGVRIFWLNLTGGTIDHPYGFAPEALQKREVLIGNIAQAYGFDMYRNLNFPTQMLETIESRILIGGIKEVFGELQPSTVFLPNRSDAHSDHRVAFDALYAVTKQFRARYIKSIYMYETLSETEFAPALIEKAFIPNTFVDISKYIDDKIRIMQMYDTEIMPDPLPRSIHAIKGLAAFRGSRIGVKYAESFQMLFNIAL